MDTVTEPRQLSMCRCCGQLAPHTCSSPFGRMKSQAIEEWIHTRCHQHPLGPFRVFDILYPLRRQPDVLADKGEPRLISAIRSVAGGKATTHVSDMLKSALFQNDDQSSTSAQPCHFRLIVVQAHAISNVEIIVDFWNS